MPDDYLEYNFKLSPLQPASDILIAQLGELGFESFVETVEGISAYIKKKDWYEDILTNVQVLSHPDFKINHAVKEIKQQNWNAVWEENLEPILVDNKCVVRAPFHKTHKLAYDIVIEPKMSFGTGHHETTYMMLRHILNLDLEGKTVLDMGCGTGVLAILAAMKGALAVDAIDIDNWCYVNSKENVERNNCVSVRVFEGDVSLLTEQKYDVILANINRNILLADIPVYAKHLNPGGLLLLSGFYSDDAPLISKKCGESKLYLLENLEKNNWIAAVYRFS